MADRFDRFTERARRVLTLAQEEAQRFNHSYIDTEHLLVGLIGESNGVAAKVLNNLGVEQSKIRSAVEFIIVRGEKTISGEIGMTPRAKKVIELAVQEARRLNHSYIGTEHLLLGLVREGEGIAFGVLASLGVSLDRVRTETARVLSQGTEPPATLRASPRSSEPLDDFGVIGELGTPRHEYKVEAQWAGWWGGFGNEGLIETFMNTRASEGWRLVRIEQGLYFWRGLVPRRRHLYIWQRVAGPYSARSQS